MCVIQLQLSEPTFPHWSFTHHILEQGLWPPHKAKPLTFSQAVADTGIPGQQGVSTVEAQDQRVRQTEDGEGVGYPVIPGPGLHATDTLKK